MKVKELIEKLKKFDKNMEVVSDYESGLSTSCITDVSVVNQFYEKDAREVLGIK